MSVATKPQHCRKYIKLSIIALMERKPNCQAQSPNPNTQILESKDLDFGWQ